MDNGAAGETVFGAGLARALAGARKRRRPNPLASESVEHPLNCRRLQWSGPPREPILALRLRGGHDPGDPPLIR